MPDELVDTCTSVPESACGCTQRTMLNAWLVMPKEAKPDAWKYEDEEPINEMACEFTPVTNV